MGAPSASQNKPNPDWSIHFKSCRSREAGQGAPALPWKVNVAEPLAHCSSAVPRGKEPNLSLLLSSFISATSLGDLGLHISSRVCTKNKRDREWHGQGKGQRDPWDVGQPPGTRGWVLQVCFQSRKPQYFNFSWLSEQQTQLLLSSGEAE